MDEIEERRHVVLRNLATHAGPARGRLRLSLDNAARLVRLAPEVISDIENGSSCTPSLAVLTHLALCLGLTEFGVPRPHPPGME
jgi:DNA-binding XRE family transcriptional regulator